MKMLNRRIAFVILTTIIAGGADTNLATAGTTKKIWCHSSGGDMHV